MKPTVLTIAGSDPSGGAGIQADLRTINALGAVGLSVISAITAQNSLGVHAVFPVDADAFTAQLIRILDDARPDAVKIGMLGSVKQVEALIAILDKRPLKPIILDPVLASTAGAELLDQAGRYLLISDLMRRCTVITPNIDEASMLSGIAVVDRETMIKAGQRLVSLGANAVLVKGGHLAGAPTDWLIQKNAQPREFVGARIETIHTHGTGCLLSSAIAAALATGKSLTDSVAFAKQIVYDSLTKPVVVGKGRGYPDASQAVSSHFPAKSRRHADRLALFKGLYVLTDPALQCGRSHLDVTKAALAGGARIIQLRDKTLTDQQLIDQSRQLANLVHAAGKLFIVNDRADIAFASGADGVHLGPDDISPQDARSLLGPDRLVGVSTGTVNEARAAAPFASYFGVGAIFGSTTKTDAGDPVTTRRVTEINSAFPAIPIVGIGGINAGNIDEVIAAGAVSAAVVSAVVAADDIENAARQLARRIT